MKQFSFPRSRILLPEHRQAINNPAPQPLHQPAHDEQRLQEFQSHLEHSINTGQVLRIVTIAGTKKLCTTGIVKKADPRSLTLLLQTLEGLRDIPVHQILDISSI